jgi:hypothetical protein
MSASVIGAIASSVTTAILALISLWTHRLVRWVKQHAQEHEFLMRSVRYNTLITREVVQHLDLDK